MIFLFLISLRVFCSPLRMDGHGNINYMWVLHIYIESPTNIQLIVFRRIRICFFCVRLDSHKIVAWFFFQFVNYYLLMGCGKIHLWSLGVFNMEHDGDVIEIFWGHQWNKKTFLMIYHLYLGRIYIIIVLCRRLWHVTHFSMPSNENKSEIIMEHIC